MKIKIKENSSLAKIAARVLRANNVAMVWGSTIHLYGVSANTFLRTPSWLRHELKHVEQYLRLGRPLFLLAYLYESFRIGYYNNRFEIEARAAEQQETVLETYV